MKTAIFALVAATTLAFSILGISFPADILGEAIGINLEDGLEIIRSSSYHVCDDVSWDRIRTAGIKMTKESWKGFLQICERLVFDLGNLHVYVDFEARMMWVYTDPSSTGADSEVHYVQFS